MPEPTDPTLTARIRSGDRVAFEALFRAVQPELARYARSLAPGDAEDARDAVQDAFVALWRRRETLDAARSVRALLYASVRHRLLNHHRDTSRRRDLLTTMDPPSAPAAPDDSTDAALVTGLIRARLATLPDRQREAFALSRFDGLSHAEVGAVMGCSTKTVENHIGRALTALRDYVRRHAPDALS